MLSCVIFAIVIKLCSVVVFCLKDTYHKLFLHNHLYIYIGHCCLDSWDTDPFLPTRKTCDLTDALKTINDHSVIITDEFGGRLTSE